MENISEHSWNSEPEVGQILACILKSQSGKDVLEIGTFKGLTYIEMVLALNSEMVYTGIDIEDHREEYIKKIMSERPNDRFIIGNSHAEMPLLKTESFDVIFIDSVHEYLHCLKEFKFAERLIRKGGIIAFHDSIKWPGVAQVVEYIKAFPHFEVLTLNTTNGNGLTIVKCNYL